MRHERQPRVDPLPEGGIRGNRQQVRQVLHQAVDHPDRRVPIGNSHVHMQPEDHPLVDHVGQPIVNPVVAFRGGDRIVRLPMKGMRARHGQVKTHRAGDVPHPLQDGKQAGRHFPDVRGTRPF